MSSSSTHHECDKENWSGRPVHLSHPVRGHHERQEEHHGWHGLQKPHVPRQNDILAHSPRTAASPCQAAEPHAKPMLLQPLTAWNML